jgi:hypothetical protein
MIEITEASHAQDIADKVRDLGDVCQLRCETQRRVMYKYTWLLRGIANGFPPPEIYCQSKQIERRPNPSLPLEPPNTRVKSVDLGFAKQKTEKPVSRGNIHSGRISHMKILEPDQSSLHELMWKNLRKESHIEEFQPLLVAF